LTTLTITRGLPGSGKTTLARRWVAEDPAHRARCNRYDFRAQLHDGVSRGQDTERHVTAAQHAAIGALLRQGVDVICDDTNLPARSVRDLRRIAVLAGGGFAVIDMTDVPLEECLRRNALRDGGARVPDLAIVDMYARYIAGRPHPLPITDEPATVSARPEPYVAPDGAPRAVMVDIDGTVALMVGRSPYDESRVHEDRPNTAVITAVRAMHSAGHLVLFCSGRTEACRTETENWLRHHVGIPFEALHMRAVGDARKDAVVKAEIFDRHIRGAYDVVAVFDDRNQVVEAWRAIGLTVFQVAAGNL
jgi:predicted kinase